MIVHLSMLLESVCVVAYASSAQNDTECFRDIRSHVMSMLAVALLLVCIQINCSQGLCVCVKIA